MTSSPVLLFTRPPQWLLQGAVKKSSHYISTGLGVLILLAIFLPNSSFAQMLSFPIIILGLVAGIKFFIDTIRSSKTKNVAVRSFLILGGFGIGAFIFIVCLIAGSIVGFAKDPNPQSTG
jgi:hypothetical protein